MTRIAVVLATEKEDLPDVATAHGATLIEGTETQCDNVRTFAQTDMSVPKSLSYGRPVWLGLAELPER